MPDSPSDPSADASSREPTAQRILDAAHRVFLRHGVAGTRTQDVADEAGVNRALINYYFRSKEGLAEAVFLGAVRSFFPRLLASLVAGGSLREKLRRAVATQIDFLDANPYLPGYLIAEFQYHPDRLRTLLDTTVPADRIRRDVLTEIQAQLDAEAEAGRLRPTRAEDLVVTLQAQVIYPYAAAPMIEATLGLDRDARDAMMARRRDDLADAVLRSFQP